MKRIVVIFLILNSGLIFADTNYTALVKKGENNLMSFKTTTGKIVTVAIKEGVSGYIVYRYGKNLASVELEFPQDKIDSWNKFRYYHYSRGGGADNLAMSESHLIFKNSNYEYTIFNDYYSEGDDSELGIRINNLKNKKIFVIQGDTNSVIGSMWNLQWGDYPIQGLD